MQKPGSVQILTAAGPKAGGSVIEPVHRDGSVPPSRAGRRPEILVRRAAHSPRSRRCYTNSQSRNACRASCSKRACAFATGAVTPGRRPAS